MFFFFFHVRYISSHRLQSSKEASLEMADKKQRANLTQMHWDTLQDIIIHGEGGKFLNALRVRNAATNMTKAEIWETITQKFIQVTKFSSPLF
jgi:hypothetical protein